MKKQLAILTLIFAAAAQARSESLWWYQTLEIAKDYDRRGFISLFTPVRKETLDCRKAGVQGDPRVQGNWTVKNFPKHYWIKGLSCIRTKLDGKLNTDRFGNLVVTDALGNSWPLRQASELDFSQCDLLSRSSFDYIPFCDNYSSSYFKAQCLNPWLNYAYKDYQRKIEQACFQDPWYVEQKKKLERDDKFDSLADDCRKRPECNDFRNASEDLTRFPLGRLQEWVQKIETELKASLDRGQPYNVSHPYGTGKILELVRQIEAGIIPYQDVLRPFDISFERGLRYLLRRDDIAGLESNRIRKTLADYRAAAEKLAKLSDLAQRTAEFHAACQSGACRQFADALLELDRDLPLLSLKKHVEALEVERRLALLEKRSHILQKTYDLPRMQRLVDTVRKSQQAFSDLKLGLSIENLRAFKLALSGAVSQAFFDEHRSKTLQAYDDLSRRLADLYQRKWLRLSGTFQLQGRFRVYEQPKLESVQIRWDETPRIVTAPLLRDYDSGERQQVHVEIKRPEIQAKQHWRLKLGEKASSQPPLPRMIFQNVKTCGDLNATIHPDLPKFDCTSFSKAGGES